MSHTTVMYQQPTTDSSLPLRPSPLRPHGGERGSRRSRARSESISKLKASYSNAARAFLHHRTEEAHALVDEAFELLHPPSSHRDDQFSSYRRKWDILRITLETTLYTTPISGKHGEASGSGVQSFTSKFTASNAWTAPRSPISPRFKTHMADDPLLLSPLSLLGTLHTRSLRLFTPPMQRPSSRCLPAAVLVALVLASLKLECPQVGSGMIDDWLKNFEPPGTNLGDDGSRGTGRSEEQEGYEKVVEVYCLHVLPRLNEWDRAQEFLDTELRLRPTKREELVATLASHHAQSLLPPSPSHSRLQSIDTSVSGSSGAPTPRAVSPTPSSVSSDTAVPNTRASNHNLSQTPISQSSTPSVATARQRHHPADATSSALVPTTIAIPPPAPSITPHPPSPQYPTIVQLLKAVIVPYLRRLNAPVVLIAMVLSFLGLFSRFGRRPKSESGAEMARQRLMGGSGGVWRGVLDAVKMSGRGLV